MKLNHLAGDHQLDGNVIATTAGDTTVAIVARVPFRATVTGAYFLPTVAATGHTTNYATLTVTNKGAAGAGTTEVASLALTSGVDLVAFDEKPITLSTTSASLNVAEGYIVSIAVAKAGTGLAIGQGKAGILLKAR